MSRQTYLPTTNYSLTKRLILTADRYHGAIHCAVYFLGLLYKYVPTHRETLFLHDKGPVQQIFFWLCFQHRSWACPLWCKIIFSLPTFFCEGLARYVVFTYRFHLWYLSCFYLRYGFVNATQRVTITLLLERRQNIALWWELNYHSMNKAWIVKPLLPVCHNLLFFLR